MPSETPAFFQAFGGTPACRKLSEAFYARVKRDPLLRPLFPGKTLTCAIEEFTAFLVQFLGGPSEDTQRRWWLSLRESHLRFKIGPAERDAWMQNMIRTLDELEVDEPIRAALRSFFEHSSAYIINQNQPALASGEIADRWETQCRLDEAASAIRNNDAARAIQLAEFLIASRACSRAVGASLLALMIGTGDSALAGYLETALNRDPLLAHEHYGGRTLLHDAAGKGSLITVEQLLRLGADPNVLSTGGHTPLYSLANECRVAGAGAIVLALVRSGADVDANRGVMRCTPLHMAARRGNVEIAKALLECGANREARDTRGETPLRRAINCRKTGVASLLRAGDATRT